MGDVDIMIFTPVCKKKNTTGNKTEIIGKEIKLYRAYL